LISEGGWDRPSDLYIPNCTRPAHLRPVAQVGEGYPPQRGGSQWFARGKREEGFLASWGPRDEKERARKTKAKKKGVWGGEIM